MATQIMTSQQRVTATLNFETPDRVPKDLGAMLSSGISAFAYPKLVETLGLPYRRPRVHDTYQMLAFPDMDVLDALGCDVVSIFNGATNAFEEPELWQEYDFNGRLPALVRDRNFFHNQSDGTIFQTLPEIISQSAENITSPESIIMPPQSYVFNEEHSGQKLDLSAELPKPDLKKIKENHKNSFPKDKEIQRLVDLCKRTRETTDKAIFISGPMYTNIAITAPGGLAYGPWFASQNQILWQNIMASRLKTP